MTNSKVIIIMYFVFNYTGWLFPLPSVIVALTMEEYKYVLVQFPPFFCASANMRLWFYSVMLIISIFLAVEVCLLIVMFWVVHKVWYV